MLLAIGWVFRGWLYRHAVTYTSVGLRTNYPATDHQLIGLIDENARQATDPDIRQIIQLALSITAGQLQYTAEKNDADPNLLIHSKKAHCVGYAAFFATTCNALIKKYHLNPAWTAQPRIGQLWFLGINVHPCFQDPFFKDHDFVTIENPETGAVIAVDPTIHDYLGINWVRYGKDSQ
jgi:hypothetical protein